MLYRTNITLGLIAAHMGHLDDSATYIAATHYKEEVGWICFEDDSHKFRQTVLARCSRLNSCPRCQRLRGAAAPRRVTERERLRRIRAAWGDYDIPGPPLVTTATVSRRVPEEEDF